MTIADAIARADALKPNIQTPEQKMAWLSELDMQINEQIIKRHEDNPFYYDENDAEEGKRLLQFPYTDEDTELIVPDVYASLYALYLMAMVDDANEETDRYQNSATKFNATYDEFHKWYHRNHMPKTRRCHELTWPY